MVRTGGGVWISQRAAAALARCGGGEVDLHGVLAMAVDTGALDAVRAAAYPLLLEASSPRAARFFLRQYRGELSRALEDVLADLRPATLPRAQEVATRLTAQVRFSF